MSQQQQSAQAQADMITQTVKLMMEQAAQVN